MKKLVAMALTLALAASMSMSVFAADAGKITGSNALNLSNTSKSVDVEIKMNTDKVATVYSVDVSWTSTTFTYSFGTATWDPSDHSVTSTTGNGWDNDAKSTFTVTNHSNKAVKVSNAFSGTKNYTIDRSDDLGVKADLTELKEHTLNAGLVGEYAKADNTTFDVKISGNPKVETGFTIGTVVITVAAAE